MIIILIIIITIIIIIFIIIEQMNCRIIDIHRCWFYCMWERWYDIHVTKASNVKKCLMLKQNMNIESSMHNMFYFKDKTQFQSLPWTLIEQ